MLEVFLFINPIGQICLKSEEALIRLAKENDYSIKFKFIPLLNLQNISHYMAFHHLNTRDLKLRNSLFKIIYSATLAYKAANCQGNKKGRAFLIALQQFACQQTQLTEAHIIQIAKQVHLDMETFTEDWHGSFVKEVFDADQQLACQMNIQTAPSAVIFNYEHDDACGMLVEDCDSYEDLKAVCQKITQDRLAKPCKLHVIS